MNKIIILLLLATIGVGCSHPTQRRVYACDCKQKAKVAQDVKESIKSANNMSDEEMEDVIRQLEHTYVRIHCVQRMVNALQRDGWYEITETDTTYTYYDY